MDKYKLSYNIFYLLNIVRKNNKLLKELLETFENIDETLKNKDINEKLQIIKDKIGITENPL